MILRNSTILYGNLFFSNQMWRDEFIMWDRVANESDTNSTSSNSSDSSSSSDYTSSPDLPGSALRPEWMAFRPGEIWTPDIAIDNR